MKIDTPKISNLTTNGFVKTSGSDGSLSVDTNTYYKALDNISVGTIEAGVTTLTGGNANNAFTLLNLNNNVTPTTGQVGQTADLVFNLQNVKSSTTIETIQAAKISAYKINDWFRTDTAYTDTNSGLKFYVTNNGIEALGMTLDNTGTISAAAIKDSSLTATRVVFAGADGTLVDSSVFTFTSGTTLSVPDVTTNFIRLGTSATPITGINFNGLEQWIYASESDDTMHFYNGEGGVSYDFIFEGSSGIGASSFNLMSNNYDYGIEEAKEDLTNWINAEHPIRLAENETKALSALSKGVEFGTDLGKSGKATAKLALNNEARIALIEQRLAEHGI